MILRDFGISCASRAKSGFLAALQEWLLRRHKSGDCPVIVIDEAQVLSTRVLEELRMLLNLEIPGPSSPRSCLPASQPLKRSCAGRGSDNCAGASCLPKPVQPLESLDALAPKPVWPPLDSPVPAMAPVNPAVPPRPAPAAVDTTYPAALGISHFLSYWRAIGQSLARDCRAFFNSFAAWLRGNSRQLPKNSPRPLNLVVSPKLLQPVSSVGVPADLPRASPGSRKDF